MRLRVILQGTAQQCALGYILAEVFLLFNCTSKELYISSSEWYMLLIGIVHSRRCTINLFKTIYVRLIYQESHSYLECVSGWLVFYIRLWEPSYGSCTLVIKGCVVGSQGDINFLSRLTRRQLSMKLGQVQGILY